MKGKGEREGEEEGVGGRNEEEEEGGPSEPPILYPCAVLRSAFA